MKKALFEGVCTALVTPFDHGAVNLTMLYRLLDRQLDAGIRAIVISGTTGESPTLTDEEKLLLFREAKRHVGDQALILAGTGSNCTRHAVSLSQAAQEQGVDGLLVVTPYYNKAADPGLMEHYSQIARAVQLPVILYNVPSRTGVDLSVSLCRQLAELPNIAGIKEASPDLKKMAHLRSACPRDFTIWSGNDDLVLPAISLGARGVISVASNVVPRQINSMVQSALQGRSDQAQQAFFTLRPLMDALFCEVNPIPVKAAMEMLSLPCGTCRLPLSEPSREHLNQIRNALQKLSGPVTENS